MRTILISGFGPFGGEPINPAGEAVGRLDRRTIVETVVVARELPVVRRACIDAIVAQIREIDPAVVIAVGQAGGRPEITPERVAINVDDYRIPDNAGNQPVDESVIVGAPSAYWSTLPVKAMVERMRGGGIPASVSNSAGTFVCNHLFFGLMHVLAAEGAIRRGGFIHIPYLPEQAARHPGEPSMGLTTIVRGLELAIEAVMTATVPVQV